MMTPASGREAMGQLPEVLNTDQLDLAVRLLQRGT
jgi:hypothetical protein